jgi:hypothetical protein
MLMRTNGIALPKLRLRFLVLASRGTNIDKAMSTEESRRVSFRIERAICMIIPSYPMKNSEGGKHIDRSLVHQIRRRDPRLRAEGALEKEFFRNMTRLQPLL